MIRLAAALAVFLAVAAPARAAETGPSPADKKSPFEAGEQTLQLPPLWVPAAGLRSRNPAVAAYRPVTLRLTSRDGGMARMCYRLPHLTEAFLIELNREPVRAGKDGRLELGGVGTRLLDEAVRVAGAGAVKSVEAIDGTPPPPTKTNQDLLALCR